MAQDKKKQDVVDAPVLRDQKATPVEAGDPVEHVALSQMGSTFAERAAARKKAEKRAVQSAENKAVGSSETKSRK